MQELICEVHRTAHESTGGDATTFTEMWDRHTSLSVRVLERLITDFQLVDLAQIWNRHIDLFQLVERAAKISDIPLPVAVLASHVRLAQRVEEVDDAGSLVLLARDSPVFASVMERIISARNARLIAPLVLALTLVAADKESFWALTDVFTPESGAKVT